MKTRANGALDRLFGQFVQDHGTWDLTNPFQLFCFTAIGMEQKIGPRRDNLSTSKLPRSRGRLSGWPKVVPLI
jgi:hypothetical protein